jgi:CRP-like cAMP-binding protein
VSATPPGTDDPGVAGMFALAGDEAVLPAGSRLVDEATPARHCFVILEGRATVEAPGRSPRTLGRGAFIGVAGAGGLPEAATRLTVSLETDARVLVVDPGRLAGLIETVPELAALWRLVAAGLPR